MYDTLIVNNHSNENCLFFPDASRESPREDSSWVISSSIHSDWLDMDYCLYFHRAFRDGWFSKVMLRRQKGRVVEGKEMERKQKRERGEIYVAASQKFPVR